MKNSALIRRFIFVLFLMGGSTLAHSVTKVETLLIEGGMSDVVLDERIECQKVIFKGNPIIVQKNEEKGLKERASLIQIKADEVVFEEGTEIKLKSSLLVKATKRVSGGHVSIKSFRGFDLPVTSSKSLSKAKSGVKGEDGGHGGHGRNASSGLFGRGATPGGHGKNGGNGKDGADGKKGETGNNGKNSANFTLIANDVDDSMDFEIVLNGSDGQFGQIGQEGGDGGRGGHGGHGGNGGNASWNHTSKHGGDGANGGSGGDGGRGGDGGDGGNGGDGGSIRIYVKGGDHQDFPIYFASYEGGEKGLGGVGGYGGKAGQGGRRGNGGRGGSSSLFHKKTADAASGVDGHDGDIGSGGRMGQHGTDGKRGVLQIKAEHVGYVTPEVIEDDNLVMRGVLNQNPLTAGDIGRSLMVPFWGDFDSHCLFDVKEDGTITFRDDKNRCFNPR